MIGNMISRIRKEKNITKTQLSKLTGINIGHLTHIEKGERNPSHKALYSICKALDIPYNELLHTYDKTLTLEQQKNNYIKFISYNKIPAFSNLETYIECPSNYTNASFAYKVPDQSMEPKFQKDSFVFIEKAGLLNNKDYGLFKINDSYVIRKLLYRKNGIILRAENKTLPDIITSELNDFSIIGKIYE